MIYKGCIMKIEDNFAIVLSDDMQYMKVIKKDGMNVGNQIIFVKDDIYNENKINYKKISALAAVVFVLFMSISIFDINNNKNMVAAAVVSLDINPSIEFELDKKGIVIKVNDINKEANEIIDKEIIGKKIEDALYITINNAREKDYISAQKSSVLISDVILDSTVKDKLNIEENLQVKLNNDKKDSYIKIVYLKSNKSNMKDAHKNDMSIGKYEAFKEIEKQNSNASVYEVKKMKVYQIFDESGKIHNDVIEVDKEDNYIEVENDSIVEENIKDESNLKKQPEKIDYSKEQQDNKIEKTESYEIKRKEKDKNKENKNEKEEYRNNEKYKRNKNNKHKNKHSKGDYNKVKYKEYKEYKHEKDKKDRKDKKDYNNHNYRIKNGNGKSYEIRKNKYVNEHKDDD